MGNDPAPRLLTIAPAAARLGVHPDTLRAWADKGLVRAVRLPSGFRRFDPAEIARVRREMGLGDADTGAGGDSAPGGDATVG